MEPLPCALDPGAGGRTRGSTGGRPLRGADLCAQKARVKPPLEPAKREFTTLLKMDPNE